MSPTVLPSWDFHGTSMGLGFPCDFRGASVVLPRDFHGTFVGRPWTYRHVSPMGFVLQIMHVLVHHLDSLGALWLWWQIRFDATATRTTSARSTTEQFD